MWPALLPLSENCVCCRFVRILVCVRIATEHCANIQKEDHQVNKVESALMRSCGNKTPANLPACGSIEYERLSPSGKLRIYFVVHTLQSV